MSKRICSLLILFLLGSTVAADQVELEATRDSGFFAAVNPGEILPMPNNFGAHVFVPVGTANTGRLNRGVFEFDLSSIPTDATVIGASFNFSVKLQGGPIGQAACRFSLHRVTSFWDEGTGETNIGEETMDGVTWTMRTAADPWNQEGGDFEPSLGKILVDGPGNYAIENALVVIQLQAMIDGSVPNFGFLLKGDPEGVLGSAARVQTRESGVPTQLNITYLDSDSNQQQVTLDAVKDSGYFAAVEESEINPTPNNFGAHTHVPVGSANNLRLNRGLFDFDLSSIPSGATINNARFDFEVTLQGGSNGQAPVDFGLYRVTSAWDEGTGESNIGDPEGGPVHWFMRTAVDPWLNLGGDFDIEVFLGADFVDGPADYSISTPELAAVIQDMVDGVVTNHGFLLKAEPEGVLGSAARVSTREGGNAAKLIVTYSEPGFLLGDVNQDGAVNLLDVAPFVDLLVSGGFSCEADANQDGAVDLLDVAPFIDIINGG